MVGNGNGNEGNGNSKRESLQWEWKSCDVDVKGMKNYFFMSNPMELRLSQLVLLGFKCSSDETNHKLQHEKLLVIITRTTFVTIVTIITIITLITVTATITITYILGRTHNRLPSSPIGLWLAGIGTPPITICPFFSVVQRLQ